MLKFLNRRWRGVTGWVYLFALVSAGLMYWMLPATQAAYQWSFRGVAYVVGFVDQNRGMLVKQLWGDGCCWHVINLSTGAEQQYADLEGVDKSCLIQSSRVPYILSRTTGLLGNQANKLVLLDERTEKVHDITNKLSDHSVLLGTGGMAVTGWNAYTSVELKTEGDAAMSKDGRWLLMSQFEIKEWNRLITWLQQKTGWNWAFAFKDENWNGVLIDLLTNETSFFVLSIHHSPRYEVHPDGLGFAVVDDDPKSLSINGLPQDIGQTTIQWYVLPFGVKHHTLNQWAMITGAFALPLLLSISRGWIRGCRREKE